MKKVVSLTAVFLLVGILVFAGDKKDKFVVKAGETCKEKIEETAKNVEGVSDATWDNVTQELEITYDETLTDTDAIEQTIADIGFDTQNHKASDALYEKLPVDCKTRKSDMSSVHPKDTISADTLEKKW